jgi:hypothetical protein
LVMVAVPCFIVNLVLLSYYKIAKKDAWMTIYYLENSKNSITSLLK